MSKDINHPKTESRTISRGAGAPETILVENCAARTDVAVFIAPQARVSQRFKLAKSPPKCDSIMEGRMDCDWLRVNDFCVLYDCR